MISFTVIDNQTGKEPDLWEIATNEDWAKRLMYCDMEGFAISEDGTLLLLDECGNFAYCPEGRFTITIDPEELRPKGEWGKVRYLPMYDTYVSPCSNCGYESTEYHKTNCPNCGAKMGGVKDG